VIMCVLEITIELHFLSHDWYLNSGRPVAYVMLYVAITGYKG